MNVETTSGMSHFDSSPRSTLYTPTVRFQTADGRIVDHTPKISNNVSNYKIGEKVPVYYDPQQPENAIAGTAFRLWYPLFVFALAGGFFALLGAVFIFLSQADRVFDLLLR